ncbi:hypothetical protein HDU91_000278, partial [Kappamyces sp. JEL0680]
MRNTSYHADTTHILICLSLAGNWDDQKEKILDKWLPEVQFYLPDAMVFLLGLQKNQVAAIQDSLCIESTGHLDTMERGQRLAKEIGAKAYLECSALVPKSCLNVAQALRKFDYNKHLETLRPPVLAEIAEETPVVPLPPQSNPDSEAFKKPLPVPDLPAATPPPPAPS